MVFYQIFLLSPLQCTATLLWKYVRDCVSSKKQKSQGKAVEVTVNSKEENSILLSRFRPRIRPQDPIAFYLSSSHIFIGSVQSSLMKHKIHITLIMYIYDISNRILIRSANPISSPNLTCPSSILEFRSLVPGPCLLDQNSCPKSRFQSQFYIFV